MLRHELAAPGSGVAVIRLRVRACLITMSQDLLFSLHGLGGTGVPRRLS
jgi:hypothetical protein